MRSFFQISLSRSGLLELYNTFPTSFYLCYLYDSSLETPSSSQVFKTRSIASAGTRSQ